MLNLFYQDLLFLAIATTFFIVVGWAWRFAKPYDLPQPLPDWFRIWFLTAQIGGGLLPLIGLGWGIWRSYSNVVAVLVSYLVMLGLQVLSEIVSLRQFRSVVFVMVPYLYLPYRIWQLYEGMTLIASDELGWIQTLLWVEIGLWTANYVLDLSQLPRLLRWEDKDITAHIK